MTNARRPVKNQDTPDRICGAEEPIDQIIDGQTEQPLGVFEDRGERLGPLARETGRHVGAKLLNEPREGLGTAPRVSQREIDLDPVGPAPVVKEHLHGIRDGAFFGIQIIAAKARILLHHHPVSKGVDARVGGYFVLVIAGRQLAIEEADGHDVLQAMVAVRRVLQTTLLADDAERGRLGGDLDALDLGNPPVHLREEAERAFGGGLRVELGRKSDLKEYILDDIAPILPLHPKGPAAEVDIVKPEARGRERARAAGLAALRHQGQPHPAARGIARRPRLARPHVRRLAVGAEAMPVHEDVGDSAQDGVLITTQ